MKQIGNRGIEMNNNPAKLKGTVRKNKLNQIFSKQKHRESSRHYCEGYDL
jgi:hypothetical protein